MWWKTKSNETKGNIIKAKYKKESNKHKHACAHSFCDALPAHTIHLKLTAVQCAMNAFSAKRIEIELAIEWFNENRYELTDSSHVQCAWCSKGNNGFHSKIVITEYPLWPSTGVQWVICLFRKSASNLRRSGACSKTTRNIYSTTCRHWCNQLFFCIIYFFTPATCPRTALICYSDASFVNDFPLWNKA